MEDWLPLTNLILSLKEGPLRTQVNEQWYLSQNLDHLYQVLSTNNATGHSRFVAYVRAAESRARGFDSLEQRHSTYFEYDPRLFHIEGIPVSASRAYIIPLTGNVYSAALHQSF
jgi:hypothetical protein